mmetsp:Transcript_49649/g.106387  ORF Transcript_49649/g.106387 Transcript_49649/m.106387 type:complete len:216 (-) Transcript_49649:216-863(-)
MGCGGSVNAGARYAAPAKPEAAREQVGQDPTPAPLSEPKAAVTEATAGTAPIAKVARGAFEAAPVREGGEPGSPDEFAKPCGAELADYEWLEVILRSQQQDGKPGARKKSLPEKGVVIGSKALQPLQVTLPVPPEKPGAAWVAPSATSAKKVKAALEKPWVGGARVACGSVLCRRLGACLCADKVPLVTNESEPGLLAAENAAAQTWSHHRGDLS